MSAQEENPLPFRGGVGEPTGAWSGHASELAIWTDGGWRFVVPMPGFGVWVAEAGVDARFVDGAWALGPAPAEAITDPVDGATVDLQARTAITAILAALRHHNLVETD